MAQNENDKLEKENNKIIEARLKEIERALLRAAKAQEAAAKVHGDKMTNIATSGYESQSGKVLGYAAETSINMSKAKAGDPAALIEQVFSALKTGIDSVLSGIEAGLAAINSSAQSLTDAKITDPKEAITKMAQESARAGHRMTRAEIEEAGRQLGASNVEADTATKDVATYYKGQGILGLISEYLFDYNVEQGLDRGKNRLGKEWSRLDTANWDYHNKLNIQNQSKVYNATTGGP